MTQSEAGNLFFFLCIIGWGFVIFIATRKK